MKTSKEINCALRSGLQAAVVTCESGRISSICIDSGAFNADALGLLRFGWWSALYFRKTPNLGNEVQAVIHIEGDDIVGEGLRQDRPKSTAGGHIITDLEDDSLQDKFVSPEQRRAAKYFRDLDVETNSKFYFAPYRRVRGDADDYRAKESDLDVCQKLRFVKRETIERRFRQLLIEAPGEAGLNLWGRIGDRRAGREPVKRSETGAQVGYLSGLQLSILDQHFAADKRAGVCQAYEWFATGEMFLRPTPIDDGDADTFSNAGPNSANAFCFAEFALLAIEMGVDAERWKRLLPALVAVQEIFPHAYGRVDKGEIQAIPASHYSPSSDFNKHHPLGCPRPVDQAVRKAITAKYSAMGYDDLRLAAGENIRRAMSGLGFSDFTPSRTDL